jgi:hypothetical protein
MMLKSVVIKYLEDTILQEVKYLTDTSSLIYCWDPSEWLNRTNQMTKQQLV